MDIHQIRTLIEADAPLSVDGLEDKYSPNGDGEHPLYIRSHWRVDVAHQLTISGYWAWVAHLLGSAGAVYNATTTAPTDADVQLLKPKATTATSTTQDT